MLGLSVVGTTRYGQMPQLQPKIFISPGQNECHCLKGFGRAPEIGDIMRITKALDYIAKAICDNDIPPED